jgi:uncharacterized protein YndB with AHSA1/START domain
MGVCRFRALLSAPLPRVWEFISDPRNMHLWASATKPVTGIDRPLQPGDRITQWRTRLFHHSSQELLVEVVVPNHSVRVREMSPQGRRMDVTATVSVEESGSPGATWIEEAISYSLGDNPFARWADRWLVNPLFQVVARWKTRQGFRRLADLLAQRSRMSTDS